MQPTQAFNSPYHACAETQRIIYRHTAYQSLRRYLLQSISLRRLVITAYLDDGFSFLPEYFTAGYKVSHTCFTKVESHHASGN